MHNFVDAKHINSLSVSAIPLVSLSATEFEVNHLFCLAGLLNGGVNSGLLNLRATDRSVVNGAHHEDIVEAKLLTYCEGHFFNHHSIANCNLVLTVH